MVALFVLLRGKFSASGWLFKTKKTQTYWFFFFIRVLLYLKQLAPLSSTRSIYNQINHIEEKIILCIYSIYKRINVVLIEPYSSFEDISMKSLVYWITYSLDKIRHIYIGLFNPLILEPLFWKLQNMSLWYQNYHSAWYFAWGPEPFDQRSS